MRQYSVIGKSVPRVDAPDKVTGSAKYCVDVELPGMLTGKVLRSIYPHARILNIDTSRAEKLRGVKAVLTPRDAPKIERKPQAVRVREPRILAIDKVRFMGEEVVAVAAVDEDVALEALNLITVEYEELPAVFDPEDAIKSGAPSIHDGESNVVASYDISKGDVEKGFREADHIFEDSFVTHSQHQCYLEPMGCVASFDPSGKLTAWISSMDPSGIRLSLTKVLKMTLSKVRVIQAHVGGAFGGKISMLPIYPICALLARAAGRPVKIVNTREEEFTGTLPRMPARIELKTGVRKDGLIVAKETKILAENGAYTDMAPVIVGRMIALSDSLYRITNTRAEAKVVYTNKSPMGAFRGFGNIQMLFALETHLEKIAEALGVDPVELRLKNAAQPGNLSIHGWQIGSCGFADCIQRAAAAAGWWEKRAKKMPNRGLGFSCSMYDCGARQTDGFGGSIAFVEFMEDGKIKVTSGEADYGQGWNTIAAQIAAEESGVPYEDVYVTRPDSDITPYSMGPWGLRVTVSGGNAVKLAAADAKRKMLALAANMLEANPADLEVSDRKVRVRGSPARAVSLAEVAQHAIFKRAGSAIVGKGIDEPDTVTRDPVTLYGNTSPAYIFAAQVAEVEVDAKTGQLKLLRFVSAHDIGQPINPAAAEGQVEGGIATGVGYGIMEEIYWSQGRVLNPGFLDYRIPTARDVPPLETLLLETDEPKTPFGVKSIGMPGTMMPTPALGNAIYDAVGVRIYDLPITADKILEVMEQNL